MRLTILDQSVRRLQAYIHTHTHIRIHMVAQPQLPYMQSVRLFAGWLQHRISMTMSVDRVVESGQIA